MISDLMAKLLNEVADIGDIFTDAPECAASAASAQNLMVLARMLATDAKVSGVVCAAQLYADGEALGDAECRVNGSVIFTTPPNFDAAAVSKWTLQLPAGVFVAATFFQGETPEDDSWVIDDAALFYSSLLSQST